MEQQIKIIREAKEAAWKRLKEFMFIQDAVIETRELTQNDMRHILDEAVDAALARLEQPKDCEECGARWTTPLLYHKEGCPNKPSYVEQPVNSGSDNLKKVAQNILKTLQEEDADFHVKGVSIKQLIAELSQVKPSAWQPIETAPKDIEILVIAPEFGDKYADRYFYAVARWDDGIKSWCEKGGNKDYPIHTPHFWQPLPAAPTLTTNGTKHE